MKLDIRNWSVSVVTDLYHVAFDNDGSPYHAECYYVVIERPDGKRFAHSTTFFGCESHFDGEDDLIFFTDIREEARKGVERLEARVKAVGSIDTAYWDEVSSTCRFIFTGNYISKIIEPIQSRTALIDFSIPNNQQQDIKAQMFRRCIEILDYEGISWNKKK